MTRASGQSALEPEKLPSGSAAGVCRKILAIDRIVEPALRKVELSRSDFDMLLDMFAANLEGRHICMWDVCQSSSMPFSTAHRHLSIMIGRGLVERLAPRGDWRKVIVGLSTDAKDLIDSIAATLSSWDARLKPDQDRKGDGMTANSAHS